MHRGEGIHKDTITAWSDATIEKITKQAEKKIDVIKADYMEDSDLFIHEVGLSRLQRPILLENEICRCTVIA